MKAFRFGINGYSIPADLLRIILGFVGGRRAGIAKAARVLGIMTPLHSRRLSRCCGNFRNLACSIEPGGGPLRPTLQVGRQRGAGGFEWNVHRSDCAMTTGSPCRFCAGVAMSVCVARCWQSRSPTLDDPPCNAAGRGLSWKMRPPTHYLEDAIVLDADNLANC
jgi:hypothetical protein